MTLQPALSMLTAHYMDLVLWGCLGPEEQRKREGGQNHLCNPVTTQQLECRNTNTDSRLFQSVETDENGKANFFNFLQKIIFK